MSDSDPCPFLADNGLMMYHIGLGSETHFYRRRRIYTTVNGYEPLVCAAADSYQI